MPSIVPASSKAAEMLSSMAPKMRKMGILVDLDGESDTISRIMYPEGINGDMVQTSIKIYPNDPCPCGSGKEYKNAVAENKIF